MVSYQLVLRPESSHEVETVAFANNRDKLEIDAMSVSSVFIDVLNNPDSDAKEMIRNRVLSLATRNM